MARRHRVTEYVGFWAALGLGLTLVLGAAPASAGKCDRADARLATTGKGDKDGDGISNCRERKLMKTSIGKPDSDDDGLDDGDEVASGCDPLDSDSDDDGTMDGEDDTPAAPPKQEVEALLDAILCPGEGVPGSITALGISAVLDDATDFDDTTCEEIAAQLAVEGALVLVEIEILEDATGALTATEVELEDDDHDDEDEDDDDGDDDEDDDDDDEGEDDD